MVGGITHRKHAPGQGRKAFRQEKVFQKIALLDCISREGLRSLGREIAVAEPSGSLARRAIGKEIQRILPVSFAARRKQLIEPVVAGRKMCALHIGVGIFAKVDGLHIALAKKRDQLQIPQRIWFQRFHVVGSGLQFVKHNVDALQAFEIHVAIGKNFVERKKQPRRLLAYDFRANKTGEIRAQIHDRVRLLPQA